MRPRLHVLRVFCAVDGSGGNPLGVFLEGNRIPPDERQAIATELGFSETVFVDDPTTAEMRIFTPAVELPLAGHPLVGTAWLLRREGFEPDVLRIAPGEVPVRFDPDLTWAAAPPEWAPPFEFEQLGDPAEVIALDGPLPGYELVGAWAWADEPAGIIRERVFCPGAGIAEDEATGSAAMRLSAQLGRPLEIHQGVNSVIHARPLDDGRVEIGGLVELDEIRP